MHPEKWLPGNTVEALSLELGRGEGSMDLGVPHPSQSEPQGPTKLMRNEGHVPMVGCSMPSVSIECSEIFYPHTAHQELFEKIDEETLAPESWDQLDIKIGNMNPFKAYIASRQATGTGYESSRQASRQDLLEASQRDNNGTTPGYSSVRVLHTECCTTRGTSVEGGHAGALSLHVKTQKSQISEESDAFSGASSYGQEDGRDECLTWTADTLPFELLDQQSPKPENLCGGSSSSKLCRDWDFKATGQDRDSSIEIQDTSLLTQYASREDISILSSHDSISYEDTNLDIMSAQICPQRSRAPTAPSLGLASTYATSVPSIACPEGSEMEFSWLAKRPQQAGSIGGTTLTPMGSASVDEAWDDLFAGGTTAHGGSVKTCLTSWEYFFPKDQHPPDQGRGIMIPFDDGPSVRTSSFCSTLAHTNLDSTPREGDGTDGQSSQRWSMSEPDAEDPISGIGFHAPSSTDMFVNNQTVAKPPMHLLPVNMRVQGNARPAASGDMIMNAFYTSQPRVPDKTTENIHHKESCNDKKENTHDEALYADCNPHRARFSVFLETGYPGVDQAAAKRISISGEDMRRKKGATPKKWKSLLSSFGQMFGCFKEERSLKESTRLEGISELPLESSDTSQQAGYGPIEISESTKPLRSVIERPQTEQPPVAARDYDAEQCAVPIMLISEPSNSKGSFLRRIRLQNRGGKRHGVSWDNLPGVSNSSRESEKQVEPSSSRHRYSERHRFLVEKIKEERFQTDRRFSAEM